MNTYKFEVQYAPTADLRFRGGYQRAIRAPNVLELLSIDTEPRQSGEEAARLGRVRREGQRINPILETEIDTRPSLAQGSLTPSLPSPVMSACTMRSVEVPKEVPGKYMNCSNYS